MAVPTWRARSTPHRRRAKPSSSNTLRECLRTRWRGAWPARSDFAAARLQFGQVKYVRPSAIYCRGQRGPARQGDRTSAVERTPRHPSRRSRYQHRRPWRSAQRLAGCRYPADAIPPGSALGFELLSDRHGRQFVRPFFRAQTMRQLRNLEPLGAATCLTGNLCAFRVAAARLCLPAVISRFQAAGRSPAALKRGSDLMRAGGSAAARPWSPAIPARNDGHLVG